MYGKLYLNYFLICCCSLKLYAQTSSRLIPPTPQSNGFIHAIDQSCGYNRKTPADLEIRYPEKRQVEAVKEILSYTGLPMNFLIFSANINNAAALIVNNERVVLYDPNTLNLVDKTSNSYWTSISIMAHEIGHHLSGHTLSSKSSNHEVELEADKFSGYILFKMGASLDQAVAAVKLLASNEATLTHPSRIKRIEAVKFGWNEAYKNRYHSAIPPPPEDEFPAEYSLFSPEMFYDPYGTSHHDEQYYKDHKSEIDNPTIYNGVILEWDKSNKDNPSGEPAPAIIVLVQNVAKIGYQNPYYKNGDKVVVYYSHPTLYNCSRVQYSWFENLLAAGRRIQFSTVWEGGSTTGIYILNHIKALGAGEE